MRDRERERKRGGGRNRGGTGRKNKLMQRDGDGLRENGELRQKKQLSRSNKWWKERSATQNLKMEKEFLLKVFLYHLTQHHPSLQQMLPAWSPLAQELPKIYPRLNHSKKHYKLHDVEQQVSKGLKH